MKSSSLTIVLVAAALLFGFIGTAAATSIPAHLAIDFRQDTWKSARGEWEITQTIDGTDVEAEVDSGGKLTWKSGKGIGIKGGWSGKVNKEEILEIDFDENKELVSYAGLWLTGFKGDVNRLKDRTKFEIELQIETGKRTIRHKLDLNDRITPYSNGVVYINLLDKDFSKFNEIDIQLNDTNGDPDKRIKFWVAGLDKNAPIPTPEPTTMLLLGTGLLGLAGFGRKKILKKNKG